MISLFSHLLRLTLSFCGRAKCYELRVSYFRVFLAVSPDIDAWLPTDDLSLFIFINLCTTSTTNSAMIETLRNVNLNVISLN
jgi:hypothetical protein